MGAYAAVVASGCSGDVEQAAGGNDASTAGDGSHDTGTNADTYTPPGDDSASETSTGDDTGSPDTSTGADTSTTDAGADAPSVMDFIFAMEEAYCKRTKDCCTAYDASTIPFDLTVCENIGAQGWESAANGLTDATAPNITYDPQKGADCVGMIYNPATNKYTCPVISATEYSTITDTCFGALAGKLAPDASCSVDLECQPGNYCMGDGGSVCSPLQGAGMPCTRNGECSYRGKGAFCGSDGGCQPALPLDAGCITNLECASGLCDENLLCSTQQTITASYNCDDYPPPDGGTD
jgi:hypothetical protein